MLIGDPLDIASLEYSKWTFDSSAKKAYSVRLDKKKKGDTSGLKAAKMLWQIKTFPFDATRRRSSALVLVQYGDELRLLKVMKGSPEEMKSFVNFSSRRKRGLTEENCTETIEKLGSHGLRVITMAAKDITTDESIFYKLFTKGLPRYSPKNDKDIHKMIYHARKVAQGGVSMNDIEKTSSDHFDLVGFSCFDTVIRPSTARVICDLKASDTNICMLTGDSPDAALVVARNAGFYEKKKTREVFY